jgi:hypothetical protein
MTTTNIACAERDHGRGPRVRAFVGTVIAAEGAGVADMRA